MKKRMILTNSLIAFFALLVMLLISAGIVMVSNKEASHRQVRNYLSLACAVYDGTNEAETLQTLKLIDENIRITIIDLEGNVKADSSLDDIAISHLDRWEIQNLGKICTRYSDTLKCDMLYIAALDDGVYLRISFPVRTMTVLTTTYLSVGILALIAILALSVGLITYFSKKSLQPVNQTLNGFVKLIDKADDYTVLSIDDLPVILESLRQALDDKIQQISNQKQQTTDVLNQIDSGLIVIDETQKIKLINAAAMRIFHAGDNAVKDKDYLYLIRDIGLQEAISLALREKCDKEYLLKLDTLTYRAGMKYIQASWISGGVILMLENITQRLELEQTKREFFANASHELKSPLTCIIGYQQMITEKIETDADRIIEYSKKTLKEANRMNDIVIDMLNLSRLERKEAMQIEDIRADILIEEILDSLQSKIKEKELKVYKSISPVVLAADRGHLDQLFRNLMDNAIKYNKSGGEIELRLALEAFTIRDTGVGISPEHQKRVFERFYRVDKAKSKTLGGTGLGLAIVKHVCEIYRYKIQLSSEANQGTTIKIEFQNK